MLMLLNVKCDPLLKIELIPLLIPLFLICVNCVQILPAQHNNNTQFKICIDRCFCFPLFEKIDNRIIYNLGKCVSSKQQYNANSLKTKCKSHSLIVHPLRLATRKHALDAAHHICVY